MDALERYMNIRTLFYQSQTQAKKSVKLKDWQDMLANAPGSQACLNGFVMDYLVTEVTGGCVDDVSLCNDGGEEGWRAEASSLGMSPLASGEWSIKNSNEGPFSYLPHPLCLTGVSGSGESV